MAPNESAPGAESDVITRADLVRNTSSLMTAYAGRTELSPTDLIDTLTKVYGVMAQISGVQADTAQAPARQIAAPPQTQMLGAPAQSEETPPAQAPVEAKTDAPVEAKSDAPVEMKGEASTETPTGDDGSAKAEPKARKSREPARPTHMGAWIVPEAEREKKPRERGRPPLQEKPIIMTQEPPAEIIAEAKAKGRPYARIVLGRPDLLPKVGACTLAQTVRKKKQVICLEDGVAKVVLKRHLTAAYNMDEHIYRARWAIPPEISIVAKDYTARKQEQALANGLGTKTVAVAKQRRTSEAAVDDEANNVVPVNAAPAVDAATEPKKTAKVRRASDASKKAKVAA